MNGDDKFLVSSSLSKWREKFYFLCEFIHSFFFLCMWNRPWFCMCAFLLSLSTSSFLGMYLPWTRFHPSMNINSSFVRENKMSETERTKNTAEVERRTMRYERGQNVFQLLFISLLGFNVREREREGEASNTIHLSSGSKERRDDVLYARRDSFIFSGLCYVNDFLFGNPSNSLVLKLKCTGVIAIVKSPVFLGLCYSDV